MSDMRIKDTHTYHVRGEVWFNPLAADDGSTKPQYRGVCLELGLTVYGETVDQAEQRLRASVERALKHRARFSGPTVVENTLHRKCKGFSILQKCTVAEDKR